MKISYSLIALVILMPACIGYAYYSKLHWLATQALAAEAVVMPAVPVAMDNSQPTSYADALRVAAQTNKNVLLYVGDDVDPSRYMMDTFSHPEVRKVMDNFVVYKATPQKDPDVIYKKGITGVPTYMVVSPDDRTLLVGTGYKPVYSFVSWLKAPYGTGVLQPVYPSELAYGYGVPGYGVGVMPYEEHRHFRPVINTLGAVAKGLRWVVSPSYRHAVWHKNHDQYIIY